MDVKELSPELQDIIKNSELKVKKKIFSFDEVKAIYLTWDKVSKKRFSKAIHTEIATCNKIYNALQEILETKENNELNDKDIQYVVDNQ